MPQVADLEGVLADAGNGVCKRGTHRMRRRKSREPVGQAEADLVHRELREDQLHDPADVFLVKLVTAEKRNGSVIFFFELVCELDSTLARGIGRVENHGKGLIQPRERRRRRLLCLNVALARDPRDRAVGRYEHTDRRVVGDDAARSELCRLGKRHGRVRPGRSDHARRPRFLGSECLGNEKSDAVDHADAKPDPPVKRDPHRLVGDEFRLGRHDGSAARRLGHAVERAEAVSLACDVRQDRRLHEAADEGRFAASHGTDDTDINIATGPFGYFLINGMLGHKLTSDFVSQYPMTWIRRL